MTLDPVEAARGFLGTPFHHQGRVKGIGVDCIGLLVGVARECGFPIADCTAYSREPDGRVLFAECEKNLDAILPALVEPGDILLFWVHNAGLPQHVGIYTGPGLIHTHAGIGKVVEHGYRGPWPQRVVAAFRYRHG